MNHHHRKVLHSIFDHPLSGNIEFKAVESVLRELGATIDNRSKARIGVTLNGNTVAFHHSQHTLPKEEVMRVRHFLQACEIDLSQYPV
jgi:hypothetical protein